MRTLLASALAAILVGCSCPLQPQTAMDPCIDANRFACFDRTAGSQPVEPGPVLFKTDSATIEIKSTIASTTDEPVSAHARGRVHRVTKTAKPTMIAAKVESPSSRIPLPPPSVKARRQHTSDAAAEPDTTRANISDSHSAGDAVANPNTGTIQEQVAAATAVAERMTVATVAPAPEPNNLANRSETASPDNTDLQVAVLMARLETRSVSDLSGKIIAIDDKYSSSNGNVRTAIVAAGAAEVQLSGGPAKAIDRFINAEVPAAVLTLGSAEAAQRFPEIAGYRIFRIPLSPRSLD